MKAQIPKYTHVRVTMSKAIESYDWLNCLICDKEFKRRRQGAGAGNMGKGARSRVSVTCSKICSRKYGPKLRSERYRERVKDDA